jgi:hypothetical protein
MTNFTIDELAQKRVIRKIAGEKATRFQQDVLLPRIASVLRLPPISQDMILEALESPHAVLRVVYGYYAFSRRGDVGDEYAAIAVEALNRLTPTDEAFDHLLESSGPISLWSLFLQVCEERRRKPTEQMNRGILDGILELVQDIHREDCVGNLFHAVRDSVIRSGKIQPWFERLVAVRGIGPKICSLMLRDIVWLYALELHVEPADRLFMQPIDAWVRRIADYVSEEVSSETTPDWVIAGKVTKMARQAGVSGIAFSMGMQYFGANEVRFIPALGKAVVAISL